MNFTSFAASGSLPSTQIPDDLSFITSKISPFAANLHSQIATCDDERRVRWVLNDGVVPVDHIEGCGKAEGGWCKLDAFVDATRRGLEGMDWAYDCCEPARLA